MTIRYELVEWENLGYNLPESLPYPRAKTIAEAAANIRSARTFVVAVENGVRRPLTEPEKSEFQSAYRDQENGQGAMAKATHTQTYCPEHQYAPLRCQRWPGRISRGTWFYAPIRKNGQS
jgi:hypothetical protein